MNKLKYLILLIIFFDAFFFRFHNLSGTPFYVYGDEAQVGIEARNFLIKDKEPVFGLGYWAIPRTYFYLISLSMRLFGNNLPAVRMLSVLMGSLNIVLFYLLLRQIHPRNYLISLPGTLVMAASAYHIHFSRLGIGQINDSLFITLLFLLFLKYAATGKKIYLMLSGIALGLSQYFFFGTRVIPIIAVLILPVLTFKKKKPFRCLGDGLIVAFFFILVILPQLYALKFNFKDNYSRIEAIGTVQSGWLKEKLFAAYPNKVFADIAVSPLLLFIKGGDRGWFYLDEIDRPVMGRIIVPLLLAGLIYRIITIKKKTSLALLIWLVLGSFINGSLANNPPHSQRLIILMPLMAIFFTDALALLFKIKKKYFMLSNILAFILVLAVVSEELFFYFAIFRNEQFAKCSHCQAPTHLGYYLGKKPAATEVFYLGDDSSFYRAIPSLPFLAGRPAVDIKDPAELPDKADQSFIVMGEMGRYEDSKLIGSKYKNYLYRPFYNLQGSQVAWAYEISR